MRRPSWWVSPAATLLTPLGVAVVTVAATVGAAQAQPGARPLDAVGVVLLIAGPATLVVRRGNGPLVVVAAALCAGGYFAAGYPGGPAFLAAVVALCDAIVSGVRRGAYVAAGCSSVVLLALYAIRFPTDPLPLSGALGWLASLAAIVVGAELWRARRERREQVLAARAESELRRVTEERLRIARELHDSVGHHVSLINVQAGVAHYLLDDDLEQARGALGAIVTSSAELLREMRATLGVLRGVDEEPTRKPVAGLAGLDELARADTVGGLAVTVERIGQVRSLPSTVDAAAYRIVQEALTNTRRHAGAGQATVVLEYRQDALVVEVADDGRGASASASASASDGGNGLIGMRERASALGGSLATGPRETGGFVVRACLPTPSPSRSP